MRADAPWPANLASGLDVAEGAALDGALKGEEAELYSAELCSDRAEELYQSTVRMRKAAAQNGNEVAEAKHAAVLRAGGGVHIRLHTYCI